MIRKWYVWSHIVHQCCGSLG